METMENQNTKNDSSEKKEIYIRKRNRKKGPGVNVIVALCVLVSFGVGFLLGSLVTNMPNKNTRDSITIRGAAAQQERNGQSGAAAANAGAERTKVSSDLPPASEMTDLIDVISAARKNGMTKRCYLTFDDGPSSKVTGKVLDVLAKYNAKATFFEVGKNIREHPDVTKRVYDEGHLVANHSYSHDYNALYATEESFSNEMKQCEQAIKDATGQDEIFKLTRFPGGSYNAGDHAAEKQIYKGTLANMGYYYCDWNTLNGDAEGKEKNAAELVDYFKSGAASYVSQGKNVIVLMHDSDVKQPTVDALDDIIEYLRANGYTFHRLDDIEMNTNG